MELAHKGTLFSFLHSSKGKNLNDEKIASMFKQVVSAVEFIHSKGVVHRDLKPENILLDKDLNVKLCDFGWSVKLKQSEIRNTFCGTYEYMAPEIFESEDYGSAVDIWSLGILLYEMYHSKSPFAGGSLIQVRDRVIRNKIEFKPELNPSAIDLILLLLKKNPGERPNAEQVLEHPYFAIVKKTEPLKQVKVEEKKSGSASRSFLKTNSARKGSFSKLGVGKLGPGEGRHGIESVEGSSGKSSFSTDIKSSLRNLQKSRKQSFLQPGSTTTRSVRGGLLNRPEGKSSAKALLNFNEPIVTFEPEPKPTLKKTADVVVEGFRKNKTKPNHSVESSPVISSAASPRKQSGLSLLLSISSKAESTQATPASSSRKASESGSAPLLLLLSKTSGLAPEKPATSKPPQPSFKRYVEFYMNGSSSFASLQSVKKGDSAANESFDFKKKLIANFAGFKSEKASSICPKTNVKVEISKIKEPASLLSKNETKITSVTAILRRRKS